MGTTLQNGVYLPNEGERNCYAGLKTNWEILDQKVADVTALQQAVAGALHREIVESLPTTDIDPNTIYMILSGTSATENVYDEYMYVNNAWELIGTSATDLTNYYTKSEVDGKLLLKASASDLTSHTGDTTIHVTTADKNKWNNQTYVFRYSSTTLVASSTNSNSLLDNADNLKVGDKVIDSSGVIYSITAIDTANSTFTIGTALIDLANDSDVVHKSGNETIAGVKSFSNDTYVKNINFTKEVASSSVSTTSILQLINTVTYTDETASKVATLNFRITADGAKAFYPNENNQYALGLQSRKWSEVRAIQYYYGSSDVEFSTKFVTTDTAQTVTGGKTFSSHVNVYNSDNTADTPNIILKNSKAEVGTEFTEQSINFVDKNNNALAKINCYGSSGTYTRLYITAYDSNNNSDGVFIRKSTTGTAILPTTSSAVTIGNSIFPYYNIQSKRFNGLEPSSLSLPSNKSDSVDISSYFTNTGTAQTNEYTVPANGYIYLQLSNIVTIHCFAFESASTTVATYIQTFSRGNDGQLYVLFPVRKNDVFKGTWYTSTTVTVTKAMFIPCQGNV